MIFQTVPTIFDHYPFMIVKQEDQTIFRNYPFEDFLREIFQTDDIHIKKHIFFSEKLAFHIKENIQCHYHISPRSLGIHYAFASSLHLINIDPNLNDDEFSITNITYDEPIIASYFTMDWLRFGIFPAGSSIEEKQEKERTENK